MSRHSEKVVGEKSLEQLLAEVREPELPPDTFTTRSVVEQSGHGPKWALQWLREKMKAGEVEYAGNALLLVRLDGKRSNVPLWRVKKKGQSTA